MKKVCIVTGTRAEYGLLKPVMSAIARTKGLDLGIIAAGMHLSDEFGRTIDEIQRDGFGVLAEIPMVPRGDTGKAMGLALGRGIMSLTDRMAKLRPDIVVVLGDRGEAFAAVVAAFHLGIVVAHIHGGDSSFGGLDEYMRHAITKMSNLHFPATKKSADRIVAMGEDPRHVHMVGSPALDSILREKAAPLAELRKISGFSFCKPVLLVLQHSVTTQIEEAADQMAETMEAVRELALETVVIYPNSDAGGRKIIRIINEYGRRCPFLRIFKSLPHRTYLGLLKHSRVLIGNSSSGIIEAPSFRLPAVNIGLRQQGRERGKNVIDTPHDRQAIRASIKKALYDRAFLAKLSRCVNPYGDGRSGRRIAEILGRVKNTDDLIRKKITY